VEWLLQIIQTRPLRLLRPLGSPKVLGYWIPALVVICKWWMWWMLVLSIQVYWMCYKWIWICKMRVFVSCRFSVVSLQFSGIRFVCLLQTISDSFGINYLVLVSSQLYQVSKILWYVRVLEEIYLQFRVPQFFSAFWVNDCASAVFEDFLFVWTWVCLFVMLNRQGSICIVFWSTLTGGKRWSSDMHSFISSIRSFIDVLARV
jgi:hypothetical protein